MRIRRSGSIGTRDSMWGGTWCAHASPLQVAYRTFIRIGVRGIASPGTQNRKDNLSHAPNGWHGVSPTYPCRLSAGAQLVDWVIIRGLPAFRGHPIVPNDGKVTAASVDPNAILVHVVGPYLAQPAFQRIGDLGRGGLQAIKAEFAAPLVDSVNGRTDSVPPKLALGGVLRDRRHDFRV